ncbi:MAG: MraY family glycosyltransferase [Pseudomonadales bacterium]
MAATLSFVLALLVTTVLLPVCRRYAPAMGLMDGAGVERKVHTSSIPRSGGIAIIGGTVVGAFLWMPPDAYYLPLMGSITIIVVVGLLDDLKDLPHQTKLVGQLMAAGLFMWAYGELPQAPFFELDAAPRWLCLLFGFGFLVGVTNGVNLSDGLDGLAAGNSLLSLCLLAIFAAQMNETGLLVLALAVAGGLLGFLRFNTHPATVFMGDTGSQFLGFTAAALALLIMQQETIPLSPMVPVLIFGLPILDTLAVMGVRLRMGRPLFEADDNHLHHQLLRLGFKHYEVVAILYGLQAVIVSLAYLLRYESDLLILGVYLLYCTSVLGFIFWARTVDWRMRSQIAVGGRIERRNHWLRRLTWYQSNAGRLLAVGVGAFLVASALYLQASSLQLANAAMIAVALLSAFWMYFGYQPKLVCRLITFTASAFVVYMLLEHPEAGGAFNWLIDAYLLAIAGALFLAVRMTRKSLFHLDNQDYLVLLIVALASVLPLQWMDGGAMARVVLRLAVLLYVCEYIATKGRNTRPLLNACALGSLIVLGLS